MLFSTLNVALGLLAAFLTESASAARRDGLSKELGNWQSLERNAGDVSDQALKRFSTRLATDVHV